MTQPYRPVAASRWQRQGRVAVEEPLAEEVPVALCYNGINHLVMMATPADLEAFGLGFSLSEGIIARPGELYGVEVRHLEVGIELDMEIASERVQALKARRHQMTGRTGCGLCGAESLEGAIRPVDPVTPAPPPTDGAIQHAVDALADHQPLQQLTGAVHAAAWCDPGGAIRWLMEDVGRHNALDKLIGTLRAEGHPTTEGFVLMTSRGSYEIVHKAATVDLANLVTLSAPTGLAVELAERAGIHLVGFARPGRHIRYTP